MKTWQQMLIEAGGSPRLAPGAPCMKAIDWERLRREQREAEDKAHANPVVMVPQEIPTDRQPAPTMITRRVDGAGQKRRPPWDWEAIQRTYRQLGISIAEPTREPPMAVPSLPDLYRRTIADMLAHIDPRQCVLLDGLGRPVSRRDSEDRSGVRILFVDQRDEPKPQPASTATPMPLRALRPPRDPSMGLTLPFDRR